MRYERSAWVPGNGATLLVSDQLLVGDGTG